MSPVPESDALFDVPEGARRPRVRVVLLTGPSGCGKTELTRRLGLPVVALDDFYLDGDHPDLPRAHGIVDWDDPRSWDGAGALAALREVAATGRACARSSSGCCATSRRHASRCRPSCVVASR